jgi:hypothetical protein
MMISEEKKAYIELLGLLQNRTGKKPEVEGVSPFLQTTDMNYDEDNTLHLKHYISKLPNTATKYNQKGTTSFYSFSLHNKSTNPINKHFIINNDFAHLFATNGNTVLITLPENIGKHLVQKKWCALHPLSINQVVSNNQYLIFSPRNLHEINITKMIIRIGYLFAIGNWEMDYSLPIHSLN